MSKIEQDSNIVEDAVNAFYEPIAQQIVTHLKEGPLCLVTGPYGIGKSKTLIPRVHSLLAEQGLRVYLNPYSGKKGPIPNGRIGITVDAYVGWVVSQKSNVFILDEAGGVRDLEEVRRLLRGIQSVGVGVFAIMAHTLRREGYWGLDGRDDFVRNWLRTEEELTGYKAPVINLEPFRLTPSLAFQLLRGRWSKGSISDKRLRLTVDFIPSNLRLLEVIEFYKGEPGIFNLDYFLHFYRGIEESLTDEELKSLDDKRETYNKAVQELWEKEHRRKHRE